MWLALKLKVLRQRLFYLLRGNAQGVSIGYISKSGSVILPTFDELVLRFPLIMLSDLKDGQSLYDEIVERQSGSIYPENYDSGLKLNAFLYAYIKAYDPKVIVETGVANGITTNVIMRALSGRQSVLHSFDIDSRTKASFTGKENWVFHLLTPPFHKNLKSVSKSIGRVDLWLHDSNHGGLWQSYEYALALSSLSPQGILVSDDVDASTAWANYVSELPGESYIVHDLRKVIGFYLPGRSVNS